VLNASNDKEGFALNRFTKSIGLSIVIVADVLKQYQFGGDSGLSWSAHLGGLVIGFLSGLLFLISFKRHLYEIKCLMPLAGLTMLMLFIIASWYWDKNDPPIPIHHDTIFGMSTGHVIDKEKEFRCCWKIIDCLGLVSFEEEKFNRQELTCDYKTLLHHRKEIPSCDYLKDLYSNYSSS
jgi:hypothetical protein